MRTRGILKSTSKRDPRNPSFIFVMNCLAVFYCKHRNYSVLTIFTSFFRSSNSFFCPEDGTEVTEVSLLVFCDFVDWMLKA